MIQGEKGEPGVRRVNGNADIKVGSCIFLIFNVKMWQPFCKMFWEMRAAWLVRTSSLYFHKARTLRHTSLLLRYNARSLRHLYERTQFMIHFSIGNHVISSAI